MEFREFSGWQTHGGAGRVESLEKSCKLCAPFPIPSPMHLFHLAVPEVYPFVINW